MRSKLTKKQRQELVWLSRQDPPWTPTEISEYRVSIGLHPMPWSDRVFHDPETVARLKEQARLSSAKRREKRRAGLLALIAAGAAATLPALARPPKSAILRAGDIVQILGAKRFVSDHAVSAAARLTANSSSPQPVTKPSHTQHLPST